MFQFSCNVEQFQRYTHSTKDNRLLRCHIRKRMSEM